MSPRDLVGNFLKEGDAVVVSMPTPFVFTLKKIHAGGLAASSGGVLPTVLELQCLLNLTTVPGQPILNVVKVQKPELPRSSVA